MLFVFWRIEGWSGRTMLQPTKYMSHTAPMFRGAASDARTLLAKTQAPVGLLQLPRTRTERHRHLDILHRVPFDLVPAHNERIGIQSSRQPVKGSIGRIMKRYRKNSIEVVLNTMLQACVDKRTDELLWDTIGATLHDEMPHMVAADAGMALACLMKIRFNRDPTLPRCLIHQIVISAAAAPASNVPVRSRGILSGSGRKHGKKHERTSETERKISTAASPRARRGLFSEHALCTGLAALHFFNLARSSVADTARLCTLVSKARSSLSNHILCRVSLHAANLAVAIRKRSGPITTLLGPLSLELCRRLDSEDVSTSDWVAGDLCVVAHAYAHTLAFRPEKKLFGVLRDHLTITTLLQLNPSELTGLANSFSKLQQADELGNVKLFDTLGRELIRGSETLGLRDICVALNAFAQTSIRHEPLFKGFESIVPRWLNDQSCGMRQLSMLAHAYVRVGCHQSSLLPLIWVRAAKLACDSDAHSLSLMLYAITKSSAAHTVGGESFIVELGRRLMSLLAGGSQNHAKVEPATVAVIIYSLARGGCASVVDPSLWKILAAQSLKDMETLPLSDVSNTATALVQVMQDVPEVRQSVEREFKLFFITLQKRIDAVQLESRSGAMQTSISPLVASKLVAAFGAARCTDAAHTAQYLARLCLVTRPSARLGIGPLRNVAQALVQLHVHDEDLLQALTTAQRPGARKMLL